MGWIGVDLDGTLAEYHGWQGIQHIGAPIPAMMNRVKQWIAEGQEVRIFTARISEKLAEPYIRQWLRDNDIGQLMITNEKDFGMSELWDDRCIRVVHNIGEPCCEYKGRTNGKDL